MIGFGILVLPFPRGWCSVEGELTEAMSPLIGSRLAAGSGGRERNSSNVELAHKVMLQKGEMMATTCNTQEPPMFLGFADC